jgi:hypothetical protein
MLRRATVLSNGSYSNAKVLPVCETFEEFLDEIRAAFGSPDYSIVYTAKGGSISDVKLIR